MMIAVQFGNARDLLVVETTTDQIRNLAHWRMFSVVPTAVSTSHAQLDTFQYAVTEQSRPIDHEEGSHGVPGIFMKYDFASFKVEVKEESSPWYQLIIRLCGIVGM